MKERTTTSSNSSARSVSPKPEDETGACPGFPITPEKFWSVFSTNLRADWTDPNKHVPGFYNNGPAWTLYITGFLKELASRFACSSDTELPRIDVGYFDRIGAEWDEWALEAAIENENGLAWNEKLSRLLMVSAGLRVLIAYSDNREWLLGILNRFVEIRKSRKYIHPESGWLFIFGPRSIPAKHDFTAFKLEGGAIVEITGDRKIVF